MKRIAVTGANGFLGRAICEALTKRGHRVVAITRDAKSAQGLAAAEIAPCGALPYDRNLEAAFAQTEVVLHTAAWAGGRTRSLSTADIKARNVDAARDMCLRARKAGVAHFVFLSSIKALASVTDGVPLRETAIAKPTDVYGASKRDAEHALMLIDGISRTIIRPPAVYGPGMSGGMRTLFTCAARGLPLPIAGITNRRDFVALANLTDFLSNAAERQDGLRTDARILHVRDGQAISTPELYEMIALALGKQARMFRIPSPIPDLAQRLPQIASTIESLYQSCEVDDRDSRALLDWSPSHSMAETLKAIAGRVA